MSKILPLLLLCACSLSGANLIPDGSFEYGLPAWNRMADLPYMPSEISWQRDSGTAFHGQSSLRGNGTKPLVIPLELKLQDGIFSIYLKSDREQAPCTVEIFGYDRFDKASAGKVKATVGRNWQRVALKLDTTNNRLKAWTVYPAIAVITPESDGTLWADAAQFEYGANPSEYQDYAASIQKNAKINVPDLKPLPLQRRPGPMPGIIEFTATHYADSKLTPVTVSLPFAYGAWHGEGGIAVTDASGKTWPAQADVIAVWPQSGSVRAAVVRFMADLKKGPNTFKASAAAPGNDPALLQEQGNGWTTGKFTISRDGQLWNIAELIVKDWQGNPYSSVNSPETTVAIDCNGPVFASVVKRGLLTNSKGASIASYSCRMAFHRGDAGISFEVTLTNLDPKNPLALQEAAVKFGGGNSGKSDAYLQYRNPNSENYAFKQDFSFGIAQSNAGTLTTPQALERHPCALSVNDAGEFTASLWPEGALRLILSANMSLHREYYYTPGNSANPAPVIAMANPKHFANTDCLTFPFGYIDAQKFPFAKLQLDNIVKTPRFNKSYVLKNNWAGIFNYGDQPGDGGWSNQESFADYSTLLLAIAYNNPEMFSMGLDRAVHYRDVDTINGQTIYHSSNHTGGGFSYSHSWPQGIMLHYFLTGSGRSRDVIEQVGECYLATPEQSKGIAADRDLALYLLGLTNLYAETGDPAYKERFFKQLRYAEKINLTESRKDDTIFPWSGRLAPFQVWYGAYALMTMYKLTGDESLLTSFRREMQASLNMFFYELDLQECWPSLSPAEGWPILLGHHSRDRGSLFYPVMLFYSEIDRNPRWLKLAQLACYTDFMFANQKEMEHVYRLSVLNSRGLQVNEAELKKEAYDLVMNAAAPEMLNGDFSYSPDWFTYWHMTLRVMGWDKLVKEWPIPAEPKDFTQIFKEWRTTYSDRVSPWRTYARCYGTLDRKNYYQAPPSLKIQVTNRWVLGRNTSVESVKIRLNPGKYRFSGYYRHDAGIAPKSFARLQVIYPGEKVLRHSFYLNAPDGQVTTIEKGMKVEITKSAKDGWRYFSLELEVKQPVLASLFFYVYLQGGHKDGFINIDDLKMEKL